MNQKCVKAIVFLVFIYSSQAGAGSFANRVGAGIQFGGILGWQGSYTFGQNNLRAALGALGFTYGYDRYIGPRNSLGIQAFGNQFKVGYGLSLNHYFNGYRNPGWIVGLDGYVGFDTLDFTGEVFLDAFFSLGDIDELDPSSERGVFISIGYQF